MNIMKANTQPYVYEIEHIETGMKYIGSRTAKNCHPDELLILGGKDHKKGYLTSSGIIKDIIQNEGNTAFKVNWIECCEDGESAILLETNKLLEVDAANNELYYNFHNNDITINWRKYCAAHGVNSSSQLPEVRKKLSEAHIGKKFSENHKRNISDARKLFYKENPHPKGMLGKRHSEEAIQKISLATQGENNPMFGKIHSEDSIEKMSESRLKWLEENPEKIMRGESHPFYDVHRYGEDSPRFGIPHSKESKEKIREGLLNFYKEHPEKIDELSEKYSGENNPMYGKSHSKISIQKQSESAKNRERVVCPHCGKECDVSNAARWHGDNCRYKGNV